MIRLNLMTPKGVLIDEDVDYFTVPSRKGPLQINGGYTPVFEVLEDFGVLKTVKGNEIKFYAIFYSSLRVEPMKALLCCEACEDGYDIDMARAESSLERAKARIEKHQEGVDIRRAQSSMGRALARIAAKTLSEGKK